ncbi:putative guanine nucleotide exchange factor [Trypoxylus dichotomus]
MDLLLKKCVSNDPQEISATLKKYTQEILTKFTFPELDKKDYRVKLWKALYDILKDEGLKECHKLCLQIIRIISREKKDLNVLVTKEYLNLVLYHAALKDEKDISKTIDYDIALEGLMCLCNIVFNATMPREMCCRNGTLETILKRLRHHKDLPADINFFNMKILFIITALCENVRTTLKEEMHGLIYLIEFLETMVKELKESNHNVDIKNEPNKLSVINTNTTIEILKTLFNLTVCSKYQQTTDEEELAHYLRLTVVLRDLLLVNIEENDKKLELDGHTIHLLLNIPDECLKPLIHPLREDEDVPCDMKYERYNMSTLHEMLRYLKSRFTPEPGVKYQNEILSPLPISSSYYVKRMLVG